MYKKDKLKYGDLVISPLNGDVLEFVKELEPGRDYLQRFELKDYIERYGKLIYKNKKV